MTVIIMHYRKEVLFEILLGNLAYHLAVLQCFDTVGWAAVRASGL